MTDKSKGIWIFWASLCVTMVVLGGLLLGFTLLMKATEPVETPQQDVPYFAEDDRPGKRENLLAVAFGCREAGSLPELVEVLCYDAPEGTLTAAVLPPETVCTLNGRTDTIRGHYDYEGMSGGVGAVKALLGVEVDRYLRVQQKGIANLADCLGGMEYEVPESVTVDGQRILAGKQLLDGRRFAAFVFEPGEKGAADAARQAEFTGRLLLGGLSVERFPDYEKLTAAVFYNCETNLNQYDFALRQQGFCSYVGRDALTVRALALDGSYSEDGTEFTPSAEGLAELRELLGG